MENDGRVQGALRQGNALDRAPIMAVDFKRDRPRGKIQPHRAQGVAYLGGGGPAEAGKIGLAGKRWILDPPLSFCSGVSDALIVIRSPVRKPIREYARFESFQRRFPYLLRKRPWRRACWSLRPAPHRWGLGRAGGAMAVGGGTGHSKCGWVLGSWRVKSISGVHGALCCDGEIF